MIIDATKPTAEYTPYFLHRDDQIAAFDVPVDEYIRRSGRNLLRYADTRAKLLAGEAFPLERSDEHGASIIHSIVTGQTALIYGNVENNHLIDNLPEGCSVEVPVAVDHAGLRPVHAGTLPPELAAHCAPHVFLQDLMVRAALDGKQARVHRAAMLDRHAQACSRPRKFAP